MKKNNFNKIKTMFRKLFFAMLMLTGMASTLSAQEVQRTQPKFWLGFSGGVNYNMYTGTTQTLNSTLMAPAAFHEGSGFGGFGSLLLEFRPVPLIGLMLNVGYDNRGGAFDQVMSPCNCPEDLKTGLSYATVQPSIRISPFGPDFYVFLGGAYNYNLNKSFTYNFDQNNGEMYTTTEGEFSNIRRDVFSTHVGIGYDIQLASADSRTQVALSPFISYHPYFGQEPRDIESWSLSTVRVGMAFKFGRGKVNEVAERVVVGPIPLTNAYVPVANSDVNFITRAPLTNPVRLTIKETFPLRNYVFFEEGSSAIPNRYVALNKDQALKFNLEKISMTGNNDLRGRSIRQMDVYSNILNILGYRMQQNPSAKITLIGASAGNGAALGKEYADAVKNYLIDVFGIESSRIAAEGRNQPVNPSEAPGGVNFLPLLREGDRRVDIVSSSVDLMEPLQLIDVRESPLESKVLFSAKSEKNQPLKTWNVKLTDENGLSQTYGPYTSEQESVFGNTILGNRNNGKYNVVMSGHTNEGALVSKESTMNLVRSPELREDESLRYSILFDFDESKTVTTYEKFLKEVVAPKIYNNNSVLIHGHTDIIGTEEYNMKLSEQRALETERILTKAVTAAGKTGVAFETLSYGMDADKAPFENNLPEERFYNRTVIIDIVR